MTTADSPAMELVSQRFSTAIHTIESAICSLTIAALSRTIPKAPSAVFIYYLGIINVTPKRTPHPSGVLGASDTAQ